MGHKLALCSLKFVDLSVNTGCSCCTPFFCPHRDRYRREWWWLAVGMGVALGVVLVVVLAVGQAGQHLSRQRASASDPSQASGDP